MSSLHYSTDHEWISGLTGLARIGITDFAAEALGDIVYVQLPEVGENIIAGEACGEVESTKSVSDLYAPAGGVVVAVNEAVVADPSLINTDPFGAGWLYEIRMPEVAGGLMTAQEYASFVAGTQK